MESPEADASTAVLQSNPYDDLEINLAFLDQLVASPLASTHLLRGDRRDRRRSRLWDSLICPESTTRSSECSHAGPRTSAMGPHRGTL